MIGAIAGDIIGSVYEYQPIKTAAFYGGVPEPIWNRAMGRLTCELGAVVAHFYERFRLPFGPGVGRSAVPREVDGAATGRQTARRPGPLPAASEGAGVDPRAPGACAPCP